MIRFRHSLVWFCLCLVAVSQCLKLEKFMKNDETEVDPEVKSSLLRRQPRFLFRSTGTTTVTATAFTSAACYATAGITAVCAKKKKRRRSFEHHINTNPIAQAREQDQSPAIIPSRTSDDEPKASARANKAMDLDSAQSSIDSSREPRFLLFYTTTFTTVTSTITSTTATTTFSITNCVPASFAYAACG